MNPISWYRGRIRAAGRRVLVAIVLAILAAPAAHAGGSASTIVPHVAHYLLSLNTRRGPGFIKAVKGHLEIRVAASCDGWAVKQFVGFDLLAEDDSRLEHLTRLEVFEARDGGEFVFTSQTWEDRGLVEELRGSARRRPDGEVRLRYSTPEREPRNLSRDTLFPTAHVAALIDQARSGARQLRTMVFDGSTEDDSFEVAALIGDERHDNADGGPAFRELATHRHWPIRLAYFRPGGKQPVAEFEMSVELFDNGVAGHMVFDYGSFAMDVTLDSLTLEPLPECDS